MRNQLRKCHWKLLGLLTLGLAVSIPTDTSAQEEEEQGNTMSLAFPTGDRDSSLLLVETQKPDSTPVGKTIRYQIKVTNLSDNMALEDVRIRQHFEGGVEITRSSVSQKDENGENGENGENNAAREGQRSPENEKDDAQTAAADQGDLARGSSEWSIERLPPGETRTISIELVGDEVGEVTGCISAKYDTALCVPFQFTQPELSLTKQAPEKADLCENFVITYTLKNEGEGAAEGVVLRDQLPEGLKTADGESKLEFDIGELGSGKTWTKEVTIQPQSRGEYTSRAVAEGKGDLDVQSQKTTTQVVGADLAVNVEGPDEEYLNKPIIYTVTVTNNGDAPAEETRLELKTGENGRMVRATQSDKEEGQASWNFGITQA